MCEKMSKREYDDREREREIERERERERGENAASCEYCSYVTSINN